MRHERYTCDKCGAEMGDPQWRTLKWDQPLNIPPHNTYSGMEAKRLELCPTCWEAWNSEFAGKDG